MKSVANKNIEGNKIQKPSIRWWIGQLSANSINNKCSLVGV